MDAAYALMVRTFSGIPGTNLLDAISRTNESFGLGDSSEETDPPAPAVSPEAQLKALLAGVKGAPV